MKPTAWAEAERSLRQPRLSAEGLATMVFRGHYMGFMRQLKPREKAQVRKIRESRGRRVAIAMARALSESSN